MEDLIITPSNQKELLTNDTKYKEIVESLLIGDDPLEYITTLEEMYLHWVGESPEISQESRRIVTAHYKMMSQFLSRLSALKNES